MSRLLDKIFSVLPVFVQEALMAAFTRRRNVLYRYNRHFNKALENTLSLESADNFAEIQATRLQELLRYATKHVAWYKRHPAYQSNSIEDYPIISKADVRQHYDDFITSRRWDKWNSMKISTSGSTGTSVTYLVSPICSAVERADINSYRSRLGYKRGDRVASFIGRKIADVTQSSPPFWRYNRPDEQLIFSYWHLSDTTLPLYVEQLIKFQPKFIHGYPSFITQIAAFIIRNELEFHAINGVFTSSENLTTSQRRLIEKAFNAPVLDRYSSAEMIGAISQCEHGAYHENPFFGILEIIDNRILFSTLHNTSMPLIRFDTGDLGEWSQKSNCPCGRKSRIVEGIDGRKEDMVVASDGRRFGRLDHLFKEVQGLIEAQIVQESLEKLTILAVADADEKHLQSTIRNAVFSKMGSAFEVEVRKVDKIQRTRAGKLRFVISKLKDLD